MTVDAAFRRLTIALWDSVAAMDLEQDAEAVVASMMVGLSSAARVWGWSDEDAWRIAYRYVAIALLDGDTDTEP